MSLHELCAQTAYNNDDKLTMVIGTYTDSGSEGLYSYRFNQNTGEFSLLDSIAIENPSYLTFDATGERIYCISENNTDNSKVTALEYEKQSGGFKILNSQPLSGSPCYVSTNDSIVIASNYGGGTLDVLEIDDKGALSPVKNTFHGSSGGPDTVRQNVPHIHCAIFSKDNKYAYASDFSSDKVLYFKVKEDGKEIIPETSVDLALEADTGTRHIIFDATGAHAYIIGELSGNITVCDVNNGFLMPKQTVCADQVHGRASADIHISPDGKHLYASNRRQNDGLAIFDINNSTGELTYKGYQPTGSHPRHFNITPNGKFVIVACRDNDKVEVYQRDQESGLLTSLSTIGPNSLEPQLSLKKPVCIQFCP